jgi:MazG family protein
MSKKTGQNFEAFVEIVKELRKKCPWDREQTLESLKPYLVEEVYEAIQAIDDKNNKRLNEEIGDMLLHVVMLSVFLSEKSRYSILDVIKSISDKMIRRHPHVFAKGKVKTKEEVWARWEKIKAKGKKHKGILESIPRSLPALYRAEKFQKRAARVGFDWDKVAGAWEKVHEEMDEIHELLKAKAKAQAKGGKAKIKEEIGDLLFAVTNVARKLEIDAEEALQNANAKFMRRFSKIEKALRKTSSRGTSVRGKKMTLKEMDALWEKAKARES